jgi:hypothetical protein
MKSVFWRFDGCLMEFCRFSGHVGSGLGGLADDLILRILETCGLVLDRGVVFQRQFSLNIQNVHHLLNLCWRVSLTFAGFLEFVVVLSTL